MTDHTNYNTLYEIMDQADHKLTTVLNSFMIGFPNDILIQEASDKYLSELQASLTNRTFVEAVTMLDNNKVIISDNVLFVITPNNEISKHEYDSVAIQKDDIVLVRDEVALSLRDILTSSEDRGKQVVKYSIHSDGTLSYFYDDGTCDISDPLKDFDYSDGVIKYIECEICGEDEEFQTKLINFTHRSKSELIYYDNEISNKEIDIVWHEVLPDPLPQGEDGTEIDTDTNEYDTLHGFKLHANIITFDFTEEERIIYYDNYDDDKSIGYLWRDEKDIELPEVEYSINITASETMQSRSLGISFSCPIYWKQSGMYSDSTSGSTRPPNTWTGGSSWTRNEITYITGPSGLDNSYDWVIGNPIPITRPDLVEGGEDFIVIHNPEDWTRKPSVKGEAGEVSKTEVILKVKKPIYLTLGCETDENGMTFFFGGREIHVPFYYMGVSNLNCNTHNFTTSISDDGYLIIDFVECDIQYPLGKVYGGDGKDGDYIEFFEVDGTSLYSSINVDGESVEFNIGDIRFPHVKEAIISDPQLLVFRNEIGEYLVTQAYYGRTKNGSLSNFPYFTDATSQHGVRSITGEYYYPDNDNTVTINISDDYNTKNVYFDNNDIVFEFNDDVYRIDLPSELEYRGVTDTMVSNNELFVEMGYIEVQRTGDVLSRQMDSITLTNTEVQFGYTDSVTNLSSTMTLPHNLKMDKIHGLDGIQLVDATKNLGSLHLTLTDPLLDTTVKVDSDNVISMTNTFMNIPDRTNNYSKTTFVLDTTDIIVRQARNAKHVDHNTAFQGDSGNSITDIVSRSATTRRYVTDHFVRDFNQYDTPYYVSSLDVDYTNNRITALSPTGANMGRVDYKLQGITGEYVIDVYESNDSIYADYGTGTTDVLLGNIPDFNGSPATYPENIALNNNKYRFSMTSGTDYVLDISPIVADRGQYISDISHTGTSITVKDSNNVTILNEPVVLSPDDATVLSSVYVDSSDRLTYTTSPYTSTSYLAYRFHGEDAGHITSLSFSGEWATATIGGQPYATPIDTFDGDDGSRLQYITYDNDSDVITYKLTGSVLDNRIYNPKIAGTNGTTLSNLYVESGYLKYDISQGQTETMTQVGILDGNDGVYVTDVFVDVNRQYNFKFSNGRDFISGNIDGIQRTTSTVDIRLNNDRKIYVEESEVFYSYESSMTFQDDITDIYYDPLNPDMLHVSSNYDLNKDIALTNGKDVLDGRWFTSIYAENGQLKVLWDDSTIENIAPFDSYDVTDIYLDIDGKLVIEEPYNGFMATTRTIGNDAPRIIDRVVLDEAYDLSILFTDTTTLNLGNVRGEVNANNLTNMTITTDKYLQGFINDTTTIGNKFIEFGFGFSIYDPFKTYHMVDSVVYNNDMLVSVIDDNTTIAEDGDSWGRVKFAGEYVSYVYKPDAISPIGMITVDNRPKLVGGSLKSPYSGIKLKERYFEIDALGNDFSNPLYQGISYNEETHIIPLTLNTGLYQWRFRDYIQEQPEPSEWSTTEEFSVVTDIAKPYISLDVTGTYPLINISGAIGDYTNIMLMVYDKNTTVMSKPLTATSYAFSFGELKFNTDYTISVLHQGSSSTAWSNVIQYNSGKTVDVTTIQPEIYYDGDITSIDVNPTFLVENSTQYTTHNIGDTNFTGRWEVLDVNGEVLWGTTNKLDIFKVTINEKLPTNVLHEIRFRYENSTRTEVSPWSNLIRFYITKEYIPTVSVSTDADTTAHPLEYDFYIELTGGYNFQHTFTSWEVVDAVSGESIITTGHTFDNAFELTGTFNPTVMGRTLNIRAQISDYYNTYSEWSAWTSVYVSTITNIIYPPIIKDYFVHDFGTTIFNGDIIFPDNVQYEVVDVNDLANPMLFNTVYNIDLGRCERSIKVEHTNFKQDTIYTIRARQFHETLGWSEWTATEYFGYAYFEKPDTYTHTILDNSLRMSIVGVGAGGGGCGASITGHYGGGGSLRYITNYSSTSSSLVVKVGAGGGWHIAGQPTIIGNVITANGGGWSSTGGSGGDAITRNNGSCEIEFGGGNGGAGTIDGAGGAGGYIGDGGDGGQISPTLESGSGGKAEIWYGRGGSISILGSAINRSMTYGSNGGDFYQSIPPVAGGGGGLGSAAFQYTADHGGAGILYGLLRYPLGFMAPWDENNI